MVAVFIPVVKLTPVAACPDHHSQADFPARIQEVSAICEGGFRFNMMFDSISRPGVSPIISTRHGVLKGALVWTATPGTFRLGDSSAFRVNRGLSLRRYMPA